ncbi:hypothetical protein JB92DRAFT_2833387 [Gautieria morchelliformis]|nr:hypothetical protein JB92DRAFT_2833387 [Gautieria morchelliformis]
MTVRLRRALLRFSLAEERSGMMTLGSLTIDEYATRAVQAAREFWSKTLSLESTFKHNQKTPLKKTGLDIVVQKVLRKAAEGSAKIDSFFGMPQETHAPSPESEAPQDSCGQIWNQNLKSRTHVLPLQIRLAVMLRHG